MKRTGYSSIDVERTLSLMPSWVKEKERRYRRQKKLSEKVFGTVWKFIEKQQKS
jgi:hypothetical protein